MYGTFKNLEICQKVPLTHFLILLGPVAMSRAKDLWKQDLGVLLNNEDGNYKCSAFVTLLNRLKDECHLNDVDVVFILQSWNGVLSPYFLSAIHFIHR